MQFDRQPDGEMRPLPKPSIDTGAGLERVTAVMQDVISNYDTDLFVPLIKRAAVLCKVDVYVPAKAGLTVPESIQRGADEKRIQIDRLLSNPSLRIIADHSRAATFLISDGVLPGNEGRNYVLRKIIRRAIRHGRMLGQEDPFLYQMVFAVRDEMKSAYPELEESANRVSKVLQAEELQFARVVSEGARRFDMAVAELLQLPVSDNKQFLKQLSVSRAMVVPGKHHVDFDEMLRELESGTLLGQISIS